MEGEMENWAWGKARQPGPLGYRVGRSNSLVRKLLLCSLQQAVPGPGTSSSDYGDGGSPTIFSLQEKKAKLPGLLNVPEQVDTTGE